MKYRVLQDDNTHLYKTQFKRFFWWVDLPSVNGYSNCLGSMREVNVFIESHKDLLLPPKWSVVKQYCVIECPCCCAMVNPELSNCPCCGDTIISEATNAK